MTHVTLFHLKVKVIGQIWAYTEKKKGAKIAPLWELFACP